MGMGHMGNGAHGQLVQRLGAHGQWDTGGIGPMDKWAMGYRGMDHMGNGVHGYGAHGQWGTGQVMCQNVKKMSNVKK